MKVKVSLSIGELAYIADVLDGRHSKDFWSDESRVKLVDKLRGKIDVSNILGNRDKF